MSSGIKIEWNSAATLHLWRFPNPTKRGLKGLGPIFLPDHIAAATISVEPSLDLLRTKPITGEEERSNWTKTPHAMQALLRALNKFTKSSLLILFVLSRNPENRTRQVVVEKNPARSFGNGEFGYESD